MDTLGLVQKLAGAEARMRIIENLLEKLNSPPQPQPCTEDFECACSCCTGVITLTLTDEEHIFLRDLTGHQWGRENETIRSVLSDQIGGQTV